jgi:hypothetical protein
MFYGYEPTPALTFHLSNLLQYLGQQPDINSLLAVKLNIFINAYWSETEELTDAKYRDIKEGIIRDRGSSGLWFYPATVRVLLFNAPIY